MLVPFAYAATSKTYIMRRTEKSEKWTVIDVSFLPVNHLQSPGVAHYFFLTKNVLVMDSCSFNEISTFLCQKMFC